MDHVDQADHQLEHMELESDEDEGTSVVRQDSTTLDDNADKEKPRGKLALAWKIRITGSRVPGKTWEERDTYIKTHFVDAEYIKQAGIQREKGKKTGVIHYQGVFILNDRKRFSTLENMFKEILPDVKWDRKQGYLEPTKCAAANEYVMKQDTREAGPWFKGETFDEIAKETVYMIDITLKQWQKRIVKIIENGAHDRHIWWFWEPCGGLGKTTFQKWLFQNYKGVMPCGGKAGDMKNGIIRWKEKTGEYPKIILINLPMTYDMSYFCPPGVEEVKDMFFFSGKYGEKGCDPVVCGPPPQVFVFANAKYTDTDKMAADRWNMVRLPNGPGKDTDVKHFDWTNSENEDSENKEIPNRLIVDNTIPPEKDETPEKEMKDSDTNYENNGYRPGLVINAVLTNQEWVEKNHHEPFERKGPYPVIKKKRKRPNPEPTPESPGSDVELCGSPHTCDPPWNGLDPEENDA